LGAERRFGSLSGWPLVGQWRYLPALALFIDYGRAWHKLTGDIFKSVKFPRDARLGYGLGLRLVIKNAPFEILRLDLGCSEEQAEQKKPVFFHLSASRFI
jgi:outer membrane protein assembly factor BamA